MSKHEHSEIDLNLFFFNTRLSEKEQINITKWYRSLPEEHRDYVKTLMHESAIEAEFFSLGD